MENLEIQKGTEVKFKDSQGKVVRGVVTNLNAKTFDCRFLSGNLIDGLDDSYATFFYSGKKGHHRYLHSNVLQIYNLNII